MSCVVCMVGEESKVSEEYVPDRSIYGGIVFRAGLVVICLSAISVPSGLSQIFGMAFR